jgi:hypothetical protein
MDKRRNFLNTPITVDTSEYISAPTFPSIISTGGDKNPHKPTLQ